jgi:hypothetical protein
MVKTPKWVVYDKDQDLINQVVWYASKSLASDFLTPARATTLAKSKDYKKVVDDFSSTITDALSNSSDFTWYTQDDLESLHMLSREERRKKIAEKMQSWTVKKLAADEFQKKSYNLSKLFDGRDGLKKIHLYEKRIDKLWDEINSIKIESMMNKRSLTMIDIEDMRLLKYAIGELEKKIDWLENWQEVALAKRAKVLKQQKNQYVSTWFAPLDSREAFIDKAINDLTLGQNMLIEWPTGTGKTKIAEEIKQRIVDKLGPVHYSVDMKAIWDVAKNIDEWKFEELIQAALYQSLSQWKLNRTIEFVDQEWIRQEKPNPLFYKSSKDDTTVSGNAASTTYDYTVRPQLKWHIEVVDQLSKFFRGIHEWVPVILDELDLVPTEVIMRLKSFFNLKAWDYLYPQEWTQNTKYQIPRGPMIIATMNGRSDKHPDRWRLDPAIMRLFPAHRRLWYLTTDEKYDWALMTLMDKNGSIPGVGIWELIDQWEWDAKTNGILKHFVDFVDEVEQCYLWQKEVNLTADGIIMKDGQKYIDQKLIETGKLEKILASWKWSGKTLTQHIKDEVKEFIVGANREDAYIMISLAKSSWLVTKEDIDSLTDDLKLVWWTNADITTIIWSQRSIRGTSWTIPFTDPYEVAMLDPFATRNIWAKHSLKVWDKGNLIEALHDAEEVLNKPKTMKIVERIRLLKDALRVPWSTIDVEAIEAIVLQIGDLSAKNSTERKSIYKVLESIIKSHPSLHYLAEQYGVELSPAPSWWKEWVEKLSETPAPIVLIQKAMREQRPEDEAIFDSCDKLLQDKTFIYYEKDSYGDICTVFPSLWLSLRYEYLRGWDMKEWEYNDYKDYKEYSWDYLISTMPSTEKRNCIYKKTIDTKKWAFIKAMDEDCYTKWYTRQKRSHIDRIFSVLAAKFGLPFESKTVAKAYMYLKWSLGCEWMNTDWHNWSDGDKYWYINNEPIRSRVILYCNNKSQMISKYTAPNLYWSVALLKEI